MFIDGDREALGAVFEFYFRDLYAYGSKIFPVKELVKDYIQELFVRLWETRSRLGEVKNLKSYLLVCLKRDLLHAIKSTHYNQFDADYENPLFVISAEDFMIEKEEGHHLCKQVADSLDKLTARQREVIYLRFYHNLDFSQISDVMEMNIQSVRNLLFRSLEKIRKDIGNTDIHQTNGLELILFQLFGVMKETSLMVTEY